MVGARPHRSAHAEYPAAMTVDLAELITQIHPPNSAAANRLDEFPAVHPEGTGQVGRGSQLLRENISALRYGAQGCPQEKKRSTDGMHPTSRTSFVQYEFHKTMQSPEGPPVATRREQTAHIGVPVLRSARMRTST